MPLGSRNCTASDLRPSPAESAKSIVALPLDKGWKATPEKAAPSAMRYSVALTQETCNATDEVSKYGAGATRRSVGLSSGTALR